MHRMGQNGRPRVALCGYSGRGRLVAALRAQTGGRCRGLVADLDILCIDFERLAKIFRKCAVHGKEEHGSKYYYTSIYR